ncbi:MAG: ribosome biogenesis GTPase Der [Candidatus Aminicenantes bacterium]|nr:ribosome biogenesis GTPase Der [Candidatus Aminicenantes bacterium]
MSSIPLITIIGVPNTGKSTLFNRMVGRRKALVHSQAGMTRDIFRQKFKIDQNWYYLQDSGGFFLDKNTINSEINKKIFKAARNSQLIIFLFDGKRELLGYEKDLFLEIKRLHKPIIAVLNKVDNLDAYLQPQSYYALKNDYIQISAEHNLGVEVLFEKISQTLHVDSQPESDFSTGARISIIGKPNVGKSSLINKILNDDMVIVSPLPGTTRDSVDLEVRRNQQTFILVDNAGIRKLQKIAEDTESAAVIRAEKEMGNSDVIVFVIDISKRIDQNDMLIAQKIVRAAKPVIIAGNKADLLAEGVNSNKFLELTKTRFNSLYFAPIIAVSALTGKNIFQLFDQAVAINEKLVAKVKISALNEMVKKILRERKLITSDKRIFNPKFVSIESYRPFFIKFHCKSSSRLNDSDELFLKKRLNQELNLIGIPIYFKVVSSR